MRPRTWWAATLIWAILCRRRLAVRVGSTLTSYGPSESTGMHLASRWAYLSEWTRRRGHRRRAWGGCWSRSSRLPRTYRSSRDEEENTWRRRSEERRGGKGWRGGVAAGRGEDIRR